MFTNVRAFFTERQVLEVDCPALSRASSIDLHIDPITAGDGFLHTSPEYGMKRLLAQGLGDIYQLSHVFRKEELGPLHNPEFTLIEWYRVGFSFEEMIEETCDLIQLFCPAKAIEKISYREAFCKFAKINATTASPEELCRAAEMHGLCPSPEWDRDTLLQLLMGFVIEPQLKGENLFVIYHYPATQAALAKTKRVDNIEVAERFEVYYEGIELANGYHELQDAKLQKERLAKALEERKAHNKELLPIDTAFLRALEHGIPDCCGVAVGFDRLMLLKTEAISLSEILPLGTSCY